MLATKIVFRFYGTKFLHEVEQYMSVFVVVTMATTMMFMMKMTEDDDDDDDDILAFGLISKLNWGIYDLKSLSG